jgi:Xaa-Pro aminopeptidase
MRNRTMLLAVLLAGTRAPAAEPDPPYQSDFPPAEFRARWARVFEAIGERAVALVQGAPMVRGFVLPRQTNAFYYLCGVETPHSYLLLDGRSRRVRLYLPPRNPRLERSEGRVLSAEDAEAARRLTGVDVVESTEALRGDWLGSLEGGPAAELHVPFAPGEGYAESRHEILQANAALSLDPLDGRLPREGQLVQLLRARYPRLAVRDLTPVLDALRAVKSPREIALIRRASQLAGHGILEAMRSARPGLLEYQLEAAARYLFQVSGSRLDGYRAIVAAGTANIWNAHYFRNDGPLRDGDLVLIDFAPDYRYYTSDVARMFPVSGRFGPAQRQILGFVLAYSNAVLRRIKPRVTVDAVLAEVRAEMEPVLARTPFAKPAYEAAARKLLETGGGAFSHPVGMAVHDDGPYRDVPLRPGHVFSVDPQLWVPEEQLYYRYEDVVAVTEAGHENFTDFLPVELDAIEEAMRPDGLVQKAPPPLPPAASPH